MSYCPIGKAHCVNEACSAAESQWADAPPGSFEGVVFTGTLLGRIGILEEPAKRHTS